MSKLCPIAQPYPFSLLLPNLSIFMHNSWFIIMIHKKEKKQRNSCKTSIHTLSKFCQIIEMSKQKCIKLVISLRYFANFYILKSFQKMNAYPHKNQLLRLEVPIWNLSNSIVDPENAFFTFSKNQTIT